MDAANYQTPLQLRRLQVLVLGSLDHSDFTMARELLEKEAVVVVGDPPSTNPPDLVVVCRSHPGVLARPLVERYQQWLPKTPIVALLGSWCEGQARTGQQWPGVEHVYWHRFPTWWQRLAQTLHEPSSAPPPNSLQATTVFIDCPYRETFEALADSLSAARCVSVWLKRGERWPLTSGPTCGIWVGGQLTDTEVPALEQFSRAIHARDGRLVALLDFPRHDRVALAHRIGVHEVLGMPWRAAELCHSLGIELEERLTAPAAQQRDAA